MKILITGAGGQLGQDCIRVMKDHHVQGCGSSDLDITNADQVRQTIDELSPNVVVNCAAYTAVDNCEKQQTSCRAVNEQGAANLAAACAEYSCRLVHVSTDYVFDGKKPVAEPYTETDQTGPLSAYGGTKLGGELAITQLLEDHVILRTAWLFGMDSNNFLKTMLRLALLNPERTIRVVDDQYGSLTWTMTLARQIEALLAADIRGIVHATAEGSSTWFGGAKYFLEKMKVPFSLEPCSTEEYPTPAHRPANSILENRILKEQGLNVMQDWQEDVDDFVGMYQKELLAQYDQADN